MTCTATITNRFWAKVHKTSSCWLWTAARTGSGYGSIRIAGHSVPAHRFSYCVTHQVALTSHECVLHSCDNPPCVNPAHLRIGTKQDNRRDFDERGEPWQRNRTRCPQGHPYSGENLIRYRNHRSCRECGRHAALAYYHKHRDAINHKRREASD